MCTCSKKLGRDFVVVSHFLALFEVINEVWKPHCAETQKLWGLTPRWGSAGSHVFIMKCVRHIVAKRVSKAVQENSKKNCPVKTFIDRPTAAMLEVAAELEVPKALAGGLELPLDREKRVVGFSRDVARHVSLSWSGGTCFWDLRCWRYSKRDCLRVTDLGSFSLAQEEMTEWRRCCEIPELSSELRGTRVFVCYVFFVCAFPKQGREKQGLLQSNTKMWHMAVLAHHTKTWHMA